VTAEAEWDVKFPVVGKPIEKMMVKDLLSPVSAN
jgi:hypothetical protein